LSISIVLRRLHQQLLLGKRPRRSPSEVVEWFGAVQAQDFAGAKWAIGLRIPDSTDEQVEREFSEGRILRTHVIRPTWHFVVPSDIQWLCELTGLRVKTANRYMQRQLGLNNEVFSRSTKVIEKALEGRKYLTRAELGIALENAGIKTKELRLAFMVMHAELDAVICSGPRRGKQFTYALVDEIIQRNKILERDEALTRIAKRYFNGHGPATLSDFAWWSGLTTADAKKGIEGVASSLGREEIDGKVYWSPKSKQLDIESSEDVILLPTFDEFFVGYSSFDKSRLGAMQNRKLVLVNPLIVAEEKVVGSWRREFKGQRVNIEMAIFDLKATTEEAIIKAAEKYGKFLRMPIDCSIKKIRS
jgi:Winged helix DNA-binding domain